MKKQLPKTFSLRKSVLTSLVLSLCWLTIPLYGSATTNVSAKSEKKEKTFKSAVFATPQTITFNALPAKVYGDIDFDGGASASSGLPITYQSSNPAVATIVNGKIHIVASGVAVITANQTGNATYNAATKVTQTLRVDLATLTVAAVNTSRFYGYPNPTFTFTYTGFVNNDTEAGLTRKPTVTTAANLQSALGDYVITPGNAASTKYRFTFIPGTLTVTKAPLTITAVSKTKAYGAAVPALTLTYTGFKNNQNANTALSTQATVIAPTINTTTLPGTYTDAITVSGATATNYDITYLPGSFTITKANLKVTAANKTKTYGTVNPALTLTYTGFVLGQTVSDLNGAVDPLTTDATDNSPVGTYAIKITGNLSADNYNITYANGSLTIGKASIRVTATNQAKTYGSDNPASYPVTYTGFVLGDTESILTSRATATTTVTKYSPAGNYNIVPSGASTSNSNYAITYVNGRFTVNKAVLTATIADATRVYGEPNPAFSITGYSGFVGNDDASVITTTPQAFTTATPQSNAGNYAISGRNGAAANYTIAYKAGTLVVTKAVLHVKADDISRPYGSTTAPYTFTYTGFLFNDNATAISTKPGIVTTATAKSPAGTTYPIKPANAVSPKYSFVYDDGGILTITKAPLTIKAVDKSKMFGYANPVLTATYVGLKNNENATTAFTTQPTIATTADATSPVGTYPITVAGAASDNYDIIGYEAASLTVSNAKLTVKAVDKVTTYGATAAPALTYQITGFVNGDNQGVFTGTISLDAPTYATTSNVGAYEIAATGTLAGPAYYDIIYLPGKITVNAAPLQVTLASASKVYGQANPAFTATYNGFVNGDTEADLTVKPIISTTATNASPVGSYAITGSTAVAGNYKPTYVGTPAKLTVTPAPLTIKAENKTRGYGQPNPQFTAAYTGFLNGDTEANLTSIPTYTTTAVVASPMGDYEITPAGAAAANYTITYQKGVLNIGKTQLLVTATPQTKVYGTANPALTLTYSGFINGDTPASLTTPAVASTTATSASAVGEYDITLSGATSNKYAIVYQTAKLKINKAPLAITANAASKTYGAANPTFTATYAGLVNGDTQTSIGALPTFTTTATTASPVGSYDINASVNGAAIANYSVTVNKGALSINKAPLTIAANAASKAYGAANPAFTATYTGFVNGDTQASLTTAPSFTTPATITSAVGSYDIVAANAVAGNYTINYTKGTLTVDKAQLTVTADSKAKIYGGTNPAFTVSYSGFVNGDTQAILTTPATANTIATTATGAGTYAIAVTGGSASNYNIAYVPGTLTINKAALTVTAANSSRNFGEANPVFTLNYAGFVNGDTEASLTAKPTLSTIASAASVAGNYAIVPANGASANYNFNYANGTLTVVAGARLVNFNTLPVKTYGDAAFDPAATSNTNEPVLYTSSNTKVASVVSGRIQINGAGTAVITANLPANANYAATTPVTQTLTVNKATQTISFAAIPTQQRGGKYDLGKVTASSGLPVYFTINDPFVASVEGNVLSAMGTGSSSIIARQEGNENYLAANAIVQTVNVLDASGLEVTARQAVSPNGDGENDVFFIEGITSFPNNRVTIVNRNGVKVFETEGYDNTSKAFKGESNVSGGMQQQGTYYYVIQYMNDKGEGRHLTGYFVLKY